MLSETREKGVNVNTEYECHQLAYLIRPNLMRWPGSKFLITMHLQLTDGSRSDTTSWQYARFCENSCALPASHHWLWMYIRHIYSGTLDGRDRERGNPCTVAHTWGACLRGLLDRACLFPLGLSPFSFTLLFFLLSVGCLARRTTHAWDQSCNLFPSQKLQMYQLYDHRLKDIYPHDKRACLEHKRLIKSYGESVSIS